MVARSQEPLFTAIIARFVAPTAGKPALMPQELGPALQEGGNRMQLRFFKDEQEEAEDFFRKKAETDKTLPDLIILGPSNIMLPYTGWKEGILRTSPRLICRQRRTCGTRRCQTWLSASAFRLCCSHST